MKVIRLMGFVPTEVGTLKEWDNDGEVLPTPVRQASVAIDKIFETIASLADTNHGKFDVYTTSTRAHVHPDKVAQFVEDRIAAIQEKLKQAAVHIKTLRSFIG
jgi:hypothetical protein